MSPQVRPSTVLAQHRKGLRALAGRHRITNVRVFGSAALGVDTPASDIDLVVTFEDGASLYDLVEFKDEAEHLLGVPVDVVSDRGDRIDDVVRSAVAV